MSDRPSYDWWRRAIQSGELGPVFETEPELGFYEWRWRNGDRHAVAVFESNDAAIVMKTATGIMMDPERDWLKICKRPILEALYRAIEAGEPWPDEPDMPVVIANLPDDPFKSLEIEIESEKEEIGHWLRGEGITDDTTADKAANWVNRIRRIEADAVRHLAQEKKPHNDAARVVKQRWDPLVEESRALAARLKSALEAYMRASDKQSAGSVGRKVAMRQHVRAHVHDYEKALHSFRNRAEVRDVVQQLANEMARQGIEAPGCEIIRERRAS